MERVPLSASQDGPLAAAVSPSLSGPRGFFGIFSSWIVFLALALLAGLP
jgi:ABC-type multidrug transport system permease subunit